MPRAAITARRSSVSKYSAARSATAMGPQRSRRNMSFLPNLRMARPVFSIAHRSPRLGSSMLGGVVERKRASVGGKRGHADVGCDEMGAVLFEFHVADDIGANGAGSVRERGA